MEKEVRQLNDLLKILIDVSDKAELLRSKIEQFKQEDIRLYRFHQRLIVKIANICIALEAIASGKVDPSSGGGKLNTSAMVFELLGQTLSLVPMFGSAPGQVGAVVSSVLNYIDKIRQINIATRIANMFTMFDMWHITQEMTIKLTEMYHFQISKISAETKYPIEATEPESDSQKKNCALYCCKIESIPHKITAKEKSYMNEQVAEFGVALLLDGISVKCVNAEDQTDLSTQFVKCVCTGEDFGLLSFFKDPEIETIDKEKKWTMYGFFRKIGIKTKEHDQYGGEVVDTNTYGFWNGTKQEAEELQLK
ncbi:unnamed protein product [Rotaria sp. Silwood2]|nr:unnamed protein product [Rotaria sp. Silwood2]